MKLLVTGTKGQLARALYERAADDDAIDLTCIGRPDLDLAEASSIRSPIHDLKPDAVISAAAYTAVDKAEDEPDQADLINAVAPGEIAKAAREIGAAIIHLSTDYVFDGDKTGSYSETDAVNPKSVYGSSKLKGERAVAAANPKHVILRTAWVYSPFGHNFVKSMLSLAEGRDHLSVVDDQYGNPTSAFDLADAVLTITKQWQRSGPTGKVYHCAGTGATTWCRLARHVFATSARYSGPVAEVAPITSAEWPTKAARPKNSQLDCSRLLNDYGWRAPEWQASVEKVIARLLDTGSETPI